MNGHICFVFWDGYLVIQVRNVSASMLVRGDPHACMFYLNGKIMRKWVTIAADALEEGNSLQSYIDIPMFFKCTLAPKNRKTDAKKNEPQS